MDDKPGMPPALSTTQPDLGVPAERAAHYRRQGWWRPELVDVLALAPGEVDGEREALVGSRTRLTRAQLSAAVSGCAARLAAAGLEPGERVVLQLPNDVESVVLALALITLGVPPVLTRPALRDHELNHLLASIRPAAVAVPVHYDGFGFLAMAQRLRVTHSSVRLLLVSDVGDGVTLGSGQLDLARLCAPAGSDVASLVEVDRRPCDVALYVMSNGTTGLPKAVPRTHEAYAHMFRTAAQASEVTSESVYLALMSLTSNFVFGCPGVVGTLAAGGRVVVSRPQDPASALELIARERVTFCAMSPSTARDWVIAAGSVRHDLSHLVVHVGGARLDEATAARLTDGLGCRLQQVYGMTEGLLNFTRLDDPGEIIRATQGRPASPGVEILLVDDAGRPVPDGETGELIARGPSVTAVYHNDASPTSFTAEGYYRTGDLAYRHESGNFVMVGRVKDVINKDDEKIPADELEALVLTYPGVRNAAAVAMPHAKWGEAVCLYVVGGKDGAPELPEMRAHLQQAGLAPFKLPERLIALPAMPLVGIGKIDKVRLRADAAARVEAETATTEPEPVAADETREAGQ